MPVAKYPKLTWLWQLFRIDAISKVNFFFPAANHWMANQNRCLCPRNPVKAMHIMFDLNYLRSAHWMRLLFNNGRQQYYALPVGLKMWLWFMWSWYQNRGLSRLCGVPWDPPYRKPSSRIEIWRKRLYFKYCIRAKRCIFFQPTCDIVSFIQGDPKKLVTIIWSNCKICFKSKMHDFPIFLHRSIKSEMLALNHANLV